MDTYDGPAVFRQNEADVEVGRCAYVTRDGQSEKEWSGEFEDPTPEHLLEVGDALLILPSGEEGRIIITEYAYRLASVGRGTFEGTGPSPALP
jgi:hypothetical protein